MFVSSNFHNMIFTFLKTTSKLLIKILKKKKFKFIKLDLTFINMDMAT